MPKSLDLMKYYGTTYIFHAVMNLVLAERQKLSQGTLDIVTRKEWGARPPIQSWPLTTPVPFTVVHHTDGARCFNQNDCSKIVRGIQVSS